jgi:putative oxidoreductase
MSSIVALIGRALMSAIFIESGLSKLTNPTGAIGYMGHVGLPVPVAAYIVAVCVEFGGGLCILLGFQTRIVAAIMAAFCIATALVAHYDPSNQEQMINFMKNICMAGGFLQLVAWGGGRYSVSKR